MRPAVLLLAAACVVESAPPDPATGGSRAAIGAQPERFVLDADADRALVGEPLPSRPGTDPPMRLRVRLYERGHEVAWPMGNEVLGHARLLPGRRVLVTTRLKEVVELDLDSDRRVTLDHDAVGAIGASPDGLHLVYCKGADAETEVWRLDRDGAAARARAVTAGMAPAWSPAISPDGRSIVFVSAATGVPALWRIDGDAAPRQITSIGVKSEPGRLPRLEAFPDGPTAPLFAGGRIVFASGGAVYAISGEGRLLATVRDADAAWWIAPGRTFGVAGGWPLARRAVSVDEAHR